MNTDVDIGIVGGGMVGGTLALTLANAGYRVCLIESQAYSGARAPQILDERSVALSWGSRILLEMMGLWRDIGKNVCPIQRIHVSEKGRLGATRMCAEEESVDALGYVVRNSVFLKHLYKRLPTAPNLILKTGSTLKEITRQVDRVELVYDSNGHQESIAIRLLIAADGLQSPVRKMMSISESETTYEQTAVVANLQCELNHYNTAYERFTSSGPLALLPLEEKVMAVVFTVESVDAEGVMALDDTGMIECLQSRFGYRLGRFLQVGKRIAFPLALVESEEQYNSRVLLMGNAARTLHPVSGQGFNLALRDIAQLLEVLTANGVQDDPGRSRLLNQFTLQRRNDQKTVVQFTDKLVRLFRGNAPVFSPIRACGLTALDLVPGLKHGLARQSMGIATRLPVVTGLADRDNSLKSH